MDHISVVETVHHRRVWTTSKGTVKCVYNNLESCLVTMGYKWDFELLTIKSGNYSVFEYLINVIEKEVIGQTVCS